jgi:hypothetical protein
VCAQYRSRGHTIYCDAGQPNDLTLFLNYESREGGDDLVRDPSLAEAIEGGGVISEPLATWPDEAEVAP